MRFILSTLILVVTSVFGAQPSSAQLPTDQLEPVCPRVDLRPRSVEIGWPRSPHKGARATGLSLAVGEALSLKLGNAITPIEFDRALANGEKIDSAVARVAASGACPLTEGPMDDVAFSLEPLKIPRIGCDQEAKRRLPASKLALVAVTDVDATIGQREPVIVQFRTEFDTITSVIVGRRYDPVTQRCEYLVRGMAGPFCHARPCEDGATWFPKENFKIEKAWVIR